MCIYVTHPLSLSNREGNSRPTVYLCILFHNDINVVYSTMGNVHSYKSTYTSNAYLFAIFFNEKFTKCIVTVKDLTFSSLLDVCARQGV